MIRSIVLQWPIIPCLCTKRTILNCLICGLCWFVLCLERPCRCWCSSSVKNTRLASDSSSWWQESQDQCFGLFSSLLMWFSALEVLLLRWSLCMLATKVLLVSTDGILVRYLNIHFLKCFCFCFCMVYFLRGSLIIKLGKFKGFSIILKHMNRFFFILYFLF